MKMKMYTFAAVAALGCSVFGHDPVDWVNTEIGGRPLAGTAIPHASLLAGETLRLEMTAE